MVEIELSEGIGSSQALIAKYLKSKRYSELLRTRFPEIERRAETFPIQIFSLDTGDLGSYDELIKHPPSIALSYDVFKLYEAYQKGASAVVLRPIVLSELEQAIVRCLSTECHSEAHQESRFPEPYLPETYCVVPQVNEMNVIELQTLVHIEADKNYSVLHMIDGQKIVSSKTLKYYDDKLSPKQFVRIHKSHLINLAHLSKISTEEHLFVQLSDGVKLPLSRRRKHALLDCLMIL